MPPPLPNPPVRPPTRGLESQSTDDLKMRVADLDTQIHCLHVQAYALMQARQDCLDLIVQDEPDFS